MSLICSLTVNERLAKLTRKLKGIIRSTPFARSIEACDSPLQVLLNRFRLSRSELREESLEIERHLLRLWIRA